MLLQIIIAHNLNRDSSVYVTFLDIKKAFDTVWIEGLLFKLYKAGMHLKVWRLVREAYRNFQCAAYIAGIPGDWFTPQRGVHQGAPLSMRLYQVYMNDLLNHLRECIYGAHIGGIDCTCPSFADDSTIIALHKYAMNELLNIANCHKVKWRYEFNTDKTVAMIWGKDGNPDLKLMLGNNVIKIVDKCKHVGVPLVSNSADEISNLHDRANKGKVLVLTARGLGSDRVPVSPVVMSKIYWSTVIPRITYGLEVTPVSDKGIQVMEKGHRNNAIVIQGLPQTTHTPAPLATLGWLSMTAYIALRKILFLWQILCLPDGNIFKRAILYVIGNCIANVNMPNNCIKISPVMDTYSMVCKYGLQDKLRKCIIENDFGNFKMEKSVIKRIVWEKEYSCWRASCLLYPEMDIYSGAIKCIAMTIWWKFVNRYPFMWRNVCNLVAIIMGAQPVKMGANWANIKYMCGLCRVCVRENAVHVLFECNELEPLRNHCWQQLMQAMPVAMAGDLSQRSNQGKLQILLSGLGGDYVPEWDNIYTEIVKFVQSMYMHRKQMYDGLHSFSANP